MFLKGRKHISWILSVIFWWIVKRLTLQLQAQQPLVQLTQVWMPIPIWTMPSSYFVSERSVRSLVVRRIHQFVMAGMSCSSGLLRGMISCYEEQSWRWYSSSQGAQMFRSWDEFFCQPPKLRRRNFVRNLQSISTTNWRNCIRITRHNRSTWVLVRWWTTCSGRSESSRPLSTWESKTLLVLTTLELCWPALRLQIADSTLQESWSVRWRRGEETKVWAEQYEMYVCSLNNIGIVQKRVGLCRQR